MSFIVQLFYFALFVFSYSFTSAAQELGHENKVISIRPLEKQQFIAIVRLKSPALLAQATTVAGEVVIPAEAKQQLLLEQETFIKEAQTLSTKVQILNQYKMVLNAVTILAPIELADKFAGLSGFSYVESEQQFARVQAFANAAVSGDETFLHNSVNFIGADKVHELLNIRGEKMKVGVADTGIDFTHKMLGGSGLPEDFKNTDPAQETEFFPNKKVVGGIDLVGTEYDASSGDFNKHIPRPDKNPIDEGGHGTHVAGSIAGIGDGVNSYSGVAPQADLYAIKVFGKSGSVGDAVIIAALEYAADPNGDLNPNDQMDVLNLSLGGGFGKPHILYKEAVKNLVLGGTVVVASAGNSGDEPYVVGAPSTVREALSVAASVDNMSHNTDFAASAIIPAGGETFLVEAIEGSISLPIVTGDVIGQLVFAGVAATDFSDSLKEKIKGNVALIDRGEVDFIEKLKRAEAAGAIGVIVANNKPGEAFTMGGDGKVKIPAIMVTLEIGQKLQELMSKGETKIQFKTDKKITKKELIDTLTSFSSRGPRSMDALLKPEIAGPGNNIISAAMGKGEKAVKMSGTSMSAPHLSGVMALLKQARPNLSPLELKALVIGTAKTLADKNKLVYPVSRQGAGRVQTYRAATTEFTAAPATLSLGEVLVEKQKVMRKFIKIKNYSTQEKRLKIALKSTQYLAIKMAEEIHLKGKEEKEIAILFTLSAHAEEQFSMEQDGFILFTEEQATTGSDASKIQEVLRVPILAVTQKISNITGHDLLVQSSSENDSAQAATSLTLKNKGVNGGVVEMFNLLGKDDRKGKSGAENSTRSIICDLQAAGYRVVSKIVEGKKIDYLQVGVKLYNPLTTWQACEVSLLIDADDDGMAEQELVGLILENLPGMSSFGDYNFASLLLDAKKAREIRLKFQQASVVVGEEKVKVDYREAVQEMNTMTAYHHSTINVIEVALDKLMRNSHNQLKVKLAILNESEGSVEPDDNLRRQWFTIDPEKGGDGYSGLPEGITIAGGQEKKILLEKGEGKKDLLLLFPHNKTVKSQSETDNQLQILRPKYSL